MGVRDEWDSYRLYDGVSIFNKTFVADLGEGQTITERVCPLKVQVDKYTNWYPTGTPSEIAGDLWAAWLLVEIGEEPAGSSTILRLESSTKGITLNSVFDCVCSGVPQGNFDYLFDCHPATGVDAWTTGWLKIKVGDADRYIELLAAAP